MAPNFNKIGIPKSPAGGAQQRLNADLAQAHALHQRGQLGRARAAYEGILRKLPKHFDALHALALISAQSGDSERSIPLFDKAIAADPTQASAYCNRGLALQNLRRLEASLASYDQAIALKYDYAIAYFNRGIVLKELGRLEPALASYRQALSIVPQWAQALYNCGDILRQLGRIDAALECYDQSLAIVPGSVEIHFDRGTLLAGLGRLDDALASFDRVLALKPDYAEAHSNRGIVLARLGRTEDAILGFDRAISIRADLADAHHNKGKVLHERGSFDDALASYAQAIAIDPHYAEAHFNGALIWLLRGDYERGLPAYEWRWRGEHWRNLEDSLEHERRSFDRPRWTGDTALAGRTVFLHAEQGFGDTLQFCRYVSRVAQLGARVILEVQPELRPLLAALPDVSRLIARGDPLPDFDEHCPLLSVPLALKSTPATIPAPLGYLRADNAKVQAWRQKLGAKTRPRVGLAWSGRSTHVNDRNRSISLADLVRYLPDFQYYCLQKEIRDADLRTLDCSPQIIRTERELLDFGDTAALCECLDLVVCVDTSVAHLNAGLGRKTWVLLPAIADWRWLLERDDSPWYPAMKLYRQTGIGNWYEVLERLRADLIAEFGSTGADSGSTRAAGPSADVTVPK
jgi:tetratricopeptide (TPR) repeat protein